jgi:hypothetical protein
MSNDIFGGLRYNEVSQKAAHNSYQRDEILVDQIAWLPALPYQGGCRALELDISQAGSGNAWSVGHKDGYEKNYRQLSQFLNELSVWSRNNRMHDVITVHLDLKHVEADFVQKLDDYIRDHLHIGIVTTVYRPGELMGREATLPAGAQKNGWPTLEQLRGKFIFCVTGNGQAKDRYARTDPKARLCFADVDVSDSDRNDPQSDVCVFFNYNLFSANIGKWGPVFRRLAGSRKIIIRGYVLNGDNLWKAALENGCHLLATDKIRNYTWAAVGHNPFVKLKPLAPR